MPAMAVRGRCQWEAFEQDLADALRSCEAPRLQPRRSALGFFPLPQTASHLAAAARALSADAVPTVLGTLLEECRRGGRQLALSKAEAWEDMEQPVAEEEAPLEPWLRGRRASPEGSPSRGEALAWQLPGRPWVSSVSAEANRRIVDDKASASTSSERPHSWSPNNHSHLPGFSASQSAAPYRDLSPSVPFDARPIVGIISSSPRGMRLESQQAAIADDTGIEGSPLQESRSLRMQSRNGSAVTLAAAITRDSATGRLWSAAQRMPLRGFPSDHVLDIPTSRMGLRRTNGDCFATSTSAATLAKLERNTVMSPFRGPQGVDLHTEVAECAICMDIFCEGEIIRTLPCCHRFHACCVDPWLVNRWQCPLCKLEVAAC